MSRLILVMPLVFVALCNCLSAQNTSSETQSSLEQFREFGQAMNGRWVADVTLIANWPGMSKKQGEKVTGHSDVRWVADKYLLENNGFAIEDNTRATTYWDPATKQIQQLIVTSAGSVGHAVIWKRNGVWKWTYEWQQLDGKKGDGTGQFRFTDGGDTYHLEGTLKLDGTELPKLHDIYRRVSK